MTVRHPTNVPDQDVIATINLPADHILDAVEALLRYSGVGIDVAIAHLKQVREELVAPPDSGPPDAMRWQPT